MKIRGDAEFKPVFFSEEIWNRGSMDTLLLLNLRRNMLFYEDMSAHWAVKFGSRTWKPPVRRAFRPWSYEAETWWDREFGKFMDWLTGLFSKRVKTEADEDMHHGFKGWGGKHINGSQPHWRSIVAGAQAECDKAKILRAV